MSFAFPIFTRDDVVRSLGAAEAQKGQAIIQNVLSASTQLGLLVAQVQGSMAKPYRVIIKGERLPTGEVSFHADCSCPVGHNCKHAAATLLARLQQQQSTPDGVNPLVLEWLASFEPTSPQKKAAAKKAPSSQLIYLLNMSLPHRPEIRMAKAGSVVDGRLAGKIEIWNNLDNALRKPISFISEEDLSILQLLKTHTGPGYWGSCYLLGGRNDKTLLAKLLETKRFFLELDDGRISSMVLKAGSERPGHLSWQRNEKGLLVPECRTEPQAFLLQLSSPYYLDVRGSEVGPVRLDGDWHVWQQLMTIPPLSDHDLPLVSSHLQGKVPPQLLPAARPMAKVEGLGRAVLHLDSVLIDLLYGYRDYPAQRGGLLDLATPEFWYGPFPVRPEDGRTIGRTDEGESFLIVRDQEAEKARLKQLGKFGLKPLGERNLQASDEIMLCTQGRHALASEANWPLFVAQSIAKLKALGWEVRLHDSFRHWAAEPTAWLAEINSHDKGYTVGLEIELEGARLPLAPLLADLVQRQPDWLDAPYRQSLPDTLPVILQTSAGQRMQVPAGRIKPLLEMLVELLDQTGDHLALGAYDAPRLVEALEGWEANGIEVARQMAVKLQQAGEVKAVVPPQGLALTLRSYQLQGLAWLQYLRANELAGILADDMGLGKTAQTLAHILLEKEQGRLDRPALIVLPTSLVPNWRHEAQRFAPDLKVLSLQGNQRKQDFDRIADHDLVLTTYPLLWRDLDALAKHDYHLLILDEAQAVKNAASRSADAVRQLNARHRLAITGTPLENHLGELWSQFDFLLPGFLGDNKAFTKLWRTPIEKRANAERRDLLARRIKPFILRRKKDEVAKELPPKTIMLREIELEGRQRELYETVRAAMDAKIKQAVADKGFARSQIEILDALLKLRQVCCDPRLLKQDSAKAVKERAKLDALMQMLPELIEEGRRVLVFSQFTSMLALIEHELDQAKLDYVLLTGDTQDRDTPVRRFQSGEVPIFLISLKAGGVGLNLTTADTVIHFDPWWNPAAENQATDRAHRIGQTKPVFVYKLIAAGSIEERILALQDRKAQLAAGILSDDHSDTPKFDESDLAALLAPLE